MATKTYTWRPVIGAEVTVTLHWCPQAHDSHWDVRLGDRDLGSVFHDANPAYGWRWRRYGSRDVRGGGLRDYTDALSAMLHELRQSGVV